MRKFNVTGTCYPEEHYMADISRQVEDACKLVRDNNYFCINRGRQYGKTTTLLQVRRKLEQEGFCVFSLSFEGLDDISYTSTGKMAATFIWLLNDYIETHPDMKIREEAKSIISEYSTDSFDDIPLPVLKSVISKINRINPNIVLIIDEVDQAGNFGSFVTFLGVLRDLYLHRKERATFQSVILAGVYDVKNIKLKMRPDDDHQMNSPWNIAVTFTSEMSLSESAICKMLSEYKYDRSLDFDENIVAREIVDWTSGYPYLVSRICQLIDSNNFGWNHEGVNEAVKYILKDKDDTLCVNFVKKLEEFPKLKNLLRSLLFAENEAFFNPMERYIEIGLMFDFLKLSGNIIKVSNRLLETMLYNLFIEENKTTSIYQASEFAKNQFVKDGFLDMPKVLDKFSYYFNKIYNEDDVKFVEEQGKKMFLLYLRPIINGIGNYYIEAETRDKTRTDIIVDYKSRQYVIELKIWHGEEYNHKGEIQLSQYLEYFDITEGYMVSFCFNKNKQPGIKEVVLAGKKLWEVVI